MVCVQLFNCGRFTLSVVTDINLLHMLVLNGSVKPGISEMSEYAEQNGGKPGGRGLSALGAYNDITAAYPDEWDEYASSTLKYHVGDMLDYTVTKAAGMLNQPFLNDQPYAHLWYYKSFGSAVRNLLFDAKVVQVLRFLAVELIYSFTWWAVKKRINWMGLGLAGCTLATMATSVVGRRPNGTGWAAFFPVPHSAGQPVGVPPVCMAGLKG
ncbi:MAG: hypothetical protein ACLRWF_01120 [Ruthenibacterium sp.]